ncbi:MAG: YtxH domain-containing protein [Candidatus Pacebacteria bacterium]|nr:YtxH domain-containing protein [Candidatus Paceibacterota bacterium]
MKNTKNQKKDKGLSKGQAVGIGVGVAAASLAAYVLFGPDAKKNRKKIKGWAVKMKGEIIEKLEDAKEITEPVYHEIVDKIKDKYAKIKGIDQGDIEEVTKEVKKHWKSMIKDIKPKAKSKTQSKKKK